MQGYDFFEFKKQILCSRTKSNKERPLFVLLNPALLHSLQYFAPKASTFLPPADFDRKKVPLSVFEDTLLPLVAVIEDMEQQTHRNLVNFEMERAILAMTQDLSVTRKCETLIHEMLHVKLLESLAWSLTSDGSLPLQYRAENATTIPEGTHTKLADIGVNHWTNTVDTFINAILHDDEDKSKSRIFEVQSDSIASSLFAVLENETANKNSSVVILNIVGAALGLRALMEVRNRMILIP